MTGRQEFNRLYQTYRFAMKNKDYATIALLDYAHGECSRAYTGKSYRSNIPQSLTLQKKLRTARIARRKKQRAWDVSTKEIKAYWEEAHYYGRA